MSAILAHAPLDLGPLPPVVVWWVAADEGEPSIRRVLPIADWKRVAPKAKLLPVEVSARQWEMYQEDLGKEPVTE